MADETTLDFPRLVYRGAHDVLGLGIGETARCEDAGDWAQKQKDGWRLTSAIPEPVKADETGAKKAKK